MTISEAARPLLAALRLMWTRNAGNNQLSPQVIAGYSALLQAVAEENGVSTKELIRQLDTENEAFEPDDEN